MYLFAEVRSVRLGVRCGIVNCLYREKLLSISTYRCNWGIFEYGKSPKIKFSSATVTSSCPERIWKILTKILDPLFLSIAALNFAHISLPASTALAVLRTSSVLLAILNDSESFFPLVFYLVILSKWGFVLIFWIFLDRRWVFSILVRTYTGHRVSS